MNLEPTSQIHPISYVTSSSTINAVYPDVEFVPIRSKIQTSDFSFNGTIMLNKDDLCRALGIVNYNQYTIHDRSV